MSDETLAIIETTLREALDEVAAGRDALLNLHARHVRHCTADGCDRMHYAKGYCHRHYQQGRKHGIRPGQ
jgi:hypothetical protein